MEGKCHVEVRGQRSDFVGDHRKATVTQKKPLATTCACVYVHVAKAKLGKF